MNLNKEAGILLGIVLATMPLWLNFVVVPSWSVRIRKIILSGSFVLYIVLIIYSLTHAVYGDKYAPYLSLCAYFFHFAFVAYTVYQLWIHQK